MSSAESDLVYSTDVARRAARFFCWHRLLSKFGLLLVVALAFYIAMLVFTYRTVGTNWMFGFWATLLGMGIIPVATSFFALPGAIAKSVSELKSPHGHVVVDDEGFTVSVGGNVMKIAWSRFRCIWIRDEFIVLGNLYFGTCLHLPTEGMTAEFKQEFVRRRRSALGA